MNKIVRKIELEQDGEARLRRCLKIDFASCIGATGSWTSAPEYDGLLTGRVVACTLEAITDANPFHLFKSRIMIPHREKGKSRAKEQN